MIKYLILWIRVKHLNSISKAETVCRKFILDIRSRDVSKFITIIMKTSSYRLKPKILSFFKQFWHFFWNFPDFCDFFWNRSFLRRISDDVISAENRALNFLILKIGFWPKPNMTPTWTWTPWRVNPDIWVFFDDLIIGWEIGKPKKWILMSSAIS